MTIACMWLSVYSESVPLFSKPKEFDDSSPWIKSLWKVRDSIWAALEEMRRQKQSGIAVERSYDVASAGDGQLFGLGFWVRRSRSAAAFLASDFANLQKSQPMLPASGLRAVHTKNSVRVQPIALSAIHQ